MPTPRKPWDGPLNARGHRPKHCRQCKQPGHTIATCPLMHDQRCQLCQQFVPIHCARCGQRGHFAKTCTAPKRAGTTKL